MWELRKMVERAFAWAESKSKTRVNPIHGEPEAFLILSDSFAVSSEDTEESIQEGCVEVEDGVFAFSFCPKLYHWFMSPKSSSVKPTSFTCRTLQGPSWTPPCLTWMMTRPFWPVLATPQGLLAPAAPAAMGWVVQLEWWPLSYLGCAYAYACLYFIYIRAEKQLGPIEV